MALFGIKRIQYCKATQLAFSGQNNPFLGIASEPTNTFTDIVCMVNSRATLTIEQAVVNKQIVYTAKLQFVTPADPMLDVDHYAFIATTNEGERILLGANTRPQVAVVTAQGVFGNAGELTAYTTTAEFKADYRPLRLPVTAAEPISGPAYDICCGQIPQPTAPDTREFDICCGQIKTSEPISGPAYDVCCGQIIGQEPTPDLLTVIWQNYDGTEVDRKTYYEGQPEPTTTVVPTKPATDTYIYLFNGWEVVSQTTTTKTYRAVYQEWNKMYISLYITFDTQPTNRIHFKQNWPNSTTEVVDGDVRTPMPIGEYMYDSPLHYLKMEYGSLDGEGHANIVSVDWTNFDMAWPNVHPIYDANNPNLRIGFYDDSWQGEI